MGYQCFRDHWIKNPTKRLAFLDEEGQNIGIYSCVMSCGCHTTSRADRCSKISCSGAALGRVKKIAAIFVSQPQCRVAMGGERGYPSMLPPNPWPILAPSPTPIPFCFKQKPDGCTAAFHSNLTSHQVRWSTLNHPPHKKK